MQQNTRRRMHKPQHGALHQCAHLRALSSHSCAMAAAPALLPLPMVTTRIGTRRTSAQGVHNAAPGFLEPGTRLDELKMRVCATHRGRQGSWSWWPLLFDCERGAAQGDACGADRYRGLWQWGSASGTWARLHHRFGVVCRIGFVCARPQRGSLIFLYPTQQNSGFFSSLGPFVSCEASSEPIVDSQDVGPQRQRHC